jgi:hypothetical protein
VTPCEVDELIRKHAGPIERALEQDALAVLIEDPEPHIRALARRIGWDGVATVFAVTDQETLTRIEETVRGRRPDYWYARGCIFVLVGDRFFCSLPPMSIARRARSGALLRRCRSRRADSVN